jgi:2-polyprenyl-6-methoxyphenol hydroxylase-like FAD-dependent oxidoreductase
VRPVRRLNRIAARRYGRGVTDVLIVGAGPVGLLLAAELRRHGVANRIVDMLAAPSPYCRAIGVSPRSMELFDDIGIVEAAADAGVWLRGMRAYVNGEPTQSMTMNGFDMPFGPLALPQNETERVLTEHLARLGGEVERGVQLTSLEQNDDGVRATLARTDAADQAVECRYLVGCDGAHSATRKALGIEFPGDRNPGDYMLGDIDLDWQEPHGFTYRFMRVGDAGLEELLVAVPLPGHNRYRLSMTADAALSAQAASSEVDHAFVADRPGPSLPQIQAVVDRLAPPGTRITTLRWSSLFRISHRLADHYASGRVFLAGDAAHIHPPTGGQGMNTGLQDAYNLAWKLGLVVRGIAAPQLLASYERERRAVGEDVVGRTQAASQAQNAGEARGLAAVLKDMQLDVHCRDGGLVRDEGSAAFTDGAPRAGERAPDARGLRRESVGAPQRAFDLLRGPQHVVFAWCPTPADEAAAVALGSAVRTRWSSLARAVAITAAPAEPVGYRPLPAVHDANGEFAAAYGLRGPAVIAIRPDGYIGFRGDGLGGDGLARYFDHLLGPA